MSSRGSLSEVLEVGRKAWPDVTVPIERLVHHAGELDVDMMKLAERAPDLFLAYACAEGDPQAIRHFESQMLSQLNLYVARFSFAPHVIDELRQQVRVKLLVGSTPGIARYSGRGPLCAWLRVTIIRMAVDVLRSTGVAEVWADTDLLDLAIGVEDAPEQAASRRLYRERFRAALEYAVGKLDKRDKTLLRLSVVDGLSGEAIGAIYRIHRATVARRFVAIRARVLLSVRQSLGLPQPATASEIRSLVNLLHQDIAISARQLLASSSR